MKVIFAGIAGTRKTQALDNLRKAVERLYPGERIYTQKTSKGRRIPVIDRMLYGDDATTFLKEPERQRKDKWRVTFEQILKQFDGAREDHHFLGLHFTYRYQQNPSCVADFSQLIKWKPDCIVTFIDDAYAVRERIHLGGYTSFTLSELVLWRAEELLIGDLLARVVNPMQPIPNFVVAIQHPAEMLARLLLRPKETVRIYTSYVITDTRNQGHLQDIIDTFRRKIREQKHCAVFDPLTIDELPPLFKIPRNIRSGSHFKYNPRKSPKHRWPVLAPDSALASNDDLCQYYPLSIPYREIEDAKTAIDTQVKIRDLRLVDQAHCLILYRPTMTADGSLSTGVTNELIHANNIGIPVVWYIKAEEDPLPKSPFAPKNPGDDPRYIYEKKEDRFWKIIEDELPKYLKPERDRFLF